MTPTATCKLLDCARQGQHADALTLLTSLRDWVGSWDRLAFRLLLCGCLGIASVDATNTCILCPQCDVFKGLHQCAA
jgi:hypothetical protein